MNLYKHLKFFLFYIVVIVGSLFVINKNANHSHQYAANQQLIEICTFIMLASAFVLVVHLIALILMNLRKK